MCQRSCLIGTKNVHCSETLNGVQVFHNRLAFRHGDSTFGQIGCYNHRQHFGGQPHSHRNSENKRFEPIAFCEAVDKKYKRNHDQHEADQQQAHFVDSFVEAGLGTYPCNTFGNCTQIGMLPGGKNNAYGRSADYVRAHKTNIIQLNHTARLGGIVQQFGDFLN